jgi:hypothetical protein
MKMTLRLGLVMSFLLMLAACGRVQPPPEMETAAVREGYRFSGEGASAFSSSQEGCTYTSVYISASRDQFREVKGAKTQSNYVEIYLSKYNECTGNESFIYGSTSDANFDINKQLTAATLTASFRACKEDYSRGTSVCGPAELTVSWTGQGKLSRGRSNNQYKTPELTVKEMFKGTSRDATATGSFSFRGKTYELSFSGSSSEAFLGSGRGSYVVIRK